MGWKSTKTISRDEAIQAIMNEMSKVYQKSNSELEDLMRDMFGDDPSLPYYGCNFTVVDEVDDTKKKFQETMDSTKFKQVYIDYMKGFWDESRSGEDYDASEVFRQYLEGEGYNVVTSERTVFGKVGETPMDKYYISVNDVDGNIIGAEWEIKPNF